MDEIREDFDRIAAVSERGWSHNGYYHAFLLRHLPPGCTQALDVGCGTGAFARLLAARCEQVLALDLSPKMIDVARERSAAGPNITFVVADVLTYPLQPAQFDCIATIAALHHLPLEETLGRLAQVLRPGGVLLVLDLFRAAGPADYASGAAGMVLGLALRLLHPRSLRRSEALRAAWDAHGRHDVYATLPQVRRACEAALPGAQVRRHLLWRYSLVWRKP